MQTIPSQLTIDSSIDHDAHLFCEDFLKGAKPRYILGRNEWARSIADIIDVDGFIDDFTDEKEFLEKPILKTQNIPQNAMVVSSVVGICPLKVRRKLLEQGVRQIDYFAFRKYSGKSLKPVMFWDDFLSDFQNNRNKYEWIYGLLRDEQSKLEFWKITNFRLSSNLTFMDGFTDAQYRQYFEDFLVLETQDEVFIDVGGFDGATSLEFIKRCPNYAGVHIFEPEPSNMAVIQNQLGSLSKVHLHPYGLSNQPQILRFSISGSSSRISEQGEMEITVKRLDDVISEPFTFLKMDIEGSELDAIEGARSSIINYHPRLAISAYHRHDDFWKIPEKILSYREDYHIFFRHYTEGVTETVMFFIPKKM